jgi:hypothetical protein
MNALEKKHPSVRGRAQRGGVRRSELGGHHG